MSSPWRGIAHRALCGASHSNPQWRLDANGFESAGPRQRYGWRTEMKEAVKPDGEPLCGFARRTVPTNEGT